MNFACGKWSRKGFRGAAGKSADEVDVVKVEETKCLSSGSANFGAVEPRPWRMTKVVLWSCDGGKMRGGAWTGVLNLEAAMNHETEVGCGTGTMSSAEDCLHNSEIISV
jgi:hypothetical protein